MVKIVTSHCGSDIPQMDAYSGGTNKRLYNNNNFVYTLKSKVKLCSIVFTKLKCLNINNNNTLNITKTWLNKIELDKLSHT